MGSVSCEQIVRDILAEMPDSIKERIAEGETPQSFTAGELVEMANVLNDHIGFLRASLARAKDSLADAQRQCRVLHAECQFLSDHVDQTSWVKLMAKMSNYIMSLRPEEYDRVFKSMGGRKVETPFGTLSIIPAFREKEL